MDYKAITEKGQEKEVSLELRFRLTMNDGAALLMFCQICQSRNVIGPFGKESIPEELQE